MLLNAIGNNNITGLFDQYVTLFPEQLSRAQRNRTEYWSRVRGYFYGENAESHKAFSNAANSVVREKALHTVRCIESYIDTLKQSHTADIPEDATAEELRMMLNEARFQLASLAVGRQLGRITTHRSIAEEYYGNPNS
jgi:hypothetical protein